MEVGTCANEVSRLRDGNFRGHSGLSTTVGTVFVAGFVIAALPCEAGGMRRFTLTFALAAEIEGRWRHRRAVMLP